MKKILILALASLLLSGTTTSAQENKSDEKDYTRGWYIGAQGALSMGEGDFTHLFNEPLDGMPELHSTNFMIDAGVRLSWNFGSKKRAKKSSAVVVPAVIVPVVPAEPTEEVVVTEQPKEEVKTPFPVIYFSFNSVWKR